MWEIQVYFAGCQEREIKEYERFLFNAHSTASMVWTKKLQKLDYYNASLRPKEVRVRTDEEIQIEKDKLLNYWRGG